MPHATRSDYEIGTTTHAEASAFIIEHHYSRSSANTSTSRTIIRRDGRLVGVALYQPPTRGAAERTLKDVGLDPAFWRSVLSLSRLAVAPGEPTNAASLLLGASIRAVERSTWPVLVTYADTRLGHTGAIYRATNWTEIGPVPAGDVWVGPNGEQRGRKRGGRTLTVAEMADLGFTRCPAAPKIKFVHVSKRHQRTLAPVPVAR